jgi:hypothetical protein
MFSFFCSTIITVLFFKSGSRMAFAQFNDSLVQEFYYTKYGEPDDPYAAQYPEQIMLKYPKVGIIG